MSVEMGIALRTTILLVCSGLLTLLMRRASASARHWVWTAGLLGAMALPLLSPALPQVELPIFSERRLAVIHPEASLPSAVEPVIIEPPEQDAMIPLDALPLPARHLSWTLRQWIQLAWGLGSMLVLVRVGGGWMQIRGLRRRSTPVHTSDWNLLLDETQRALGMDRSVELRIGPEGIPPLAWGFTKSVILLPASAKRWEMERRQMVLAHELAHIERGDPLTQVFAQIACSIYWFNPVVWVAAHRMRIERERACDDRVLVLGVVAGNYARNLLDIAREINSGFSFATVSMAHPRELEARLLSILNPLLPRKAASRWAGMALAGLTAMIALPVAAIQFTTLATLVTPAMAMLPAPSMATLFRNPETPAKGIQASPIGAGGIEERSALQGVITNSVTRQPVAGADIRWSRVATQPAQASPSEPVTQTILISGADGRFRVPDLSSGEYTMQVSAPGYSPKYYGIRSGTSSEPAIEITGIEVRNLTVALDPMGGVSGRVMDTSGRPLAGIGVQLLMPIYNATGRRALRAGGDARTDDRGEYRIHSVVNGQYYLVAGSTSVTSSAGARGGAMSPNEVPGQGITPMYYPGVAEISAARLIDLRPGAEIGGLDFLSQRQQAHRIRGRVVDASTGMPPAFASVSVVTLTLAGGTRTAGNMRNYNPIDGGFDLRDVESGPHLLRVEVIEPSLAPLPFVAPVPLMIGGVGGAGGGISAVRGRVVATVHTAVQVVGADIDDLVITVPKVIKIRGRVRIEGDLGAVPTRRRVQLWPWVDGAVSTSPPGPPAVNVEADGTFELDGVSPGEYRLAVAAGVPKAYIKDARFGAVDALNSPIQVTGSDSAQLTITISLKPGQVEGTVRDERLQPVKGVSAVLIPNQHRDRPETYVIAAVDKNGHFLMNNVVPGDYKVFAWTSIEPYSYFEPDVVRRFERAGEAVHVAEDSSVSVQVKVIP